MLALAFVPLTAPAPAQAAEVTTLGRTAGVRTHSALGPNVAGTLGRPLFRGATTTIVGRGVVSAGSRRLCAAEEGFRYFGGEELPEPQDGAEARSSARSARCPQ